jgi:hypothetical protein
MGFQMDSVTVCFSPPFLKTFTADDGSHFEKPQLKEKVTLSL